MIDFRYYMITDRHMCAPAPLLDTVEEALFGGIKAVQLREKDLPGRELFDLAVKLRVITKSYHARLFINERVDVAMAVDADGVHCRETSLPVDVIKRIAPDLLVGQSVHNLQSAKVAEQQGADFVQFGPIYETPSKKKYGDPQGLEKLEKVAAAVDIPVMAVGGITPGRTESCLQAGAQGVAGISAIMQSNNIAHTVDEFSAFLF